MTTLEEIDPAPASADLTYVAAEDWTTEAVAAVSVDGELDPEINTDFQVDPAYTTSKQLKEEQSEAARSANKDGIRSLKSAVIISGAVVAVIGVLFVVAKKIKEARD
ncbi:uncharacterized protein LOC130761082 [Actinidia eriantha]|uniref:uncharacterized protein LOC130761082 n=1 Tax=Actinidia eriantha TaxID=165200 RepID=UPI00258EEAFD|nr:uncharacterized protein LOC130761082 [Actinidia eriantha]